MKKRILISTLLIATLLLVQSCGEKESLQEFFAGTLPNIEIRNGESVRYIEPKSLFIRILNDKVEVEGQLYPIERLLADEEKIVFAADFPIDPEVTVSGMTYRISEQKLDLDLGTLNRNITLEQFDRMIRRKASSFVEVDLSADISHLSENQKEMLRLLFKVADIMEDIYWAQVFPDRDAALASMVNDDVSRFFKINYGPWERLNGNLPYLPDYGTKPAGSGYYPADMTRAEFEAIEDPAKTSLYTIIRRSKGGNLQVIPYHEAWADKVKEASVLLNEAAELAEDSGFKKYLKLRAEALLTDDYLASDMAWMDMKSNNIDFVVGPIENYEDALYNYKAAHESFILIKDQEWSEKLAFISSVLPQMQKTLPVPPEYKRETPGSDSDLGAYDVDWFKLEYETAPRWAFATMLEINNKYEDQRTAAEAEGPFLSGQVTYTISRGGNLNLWFGSRQAGYLCSGGVCKFEPAFEGVEVYGLFRY